MEDEGYINVVNALREFVADIEAVGIGETARDWPDLAHTYEKAKQALSPRTDRNGKSLEGRSSDGPLDYTERAYDFQANSLRDRAQHGHALCRKIQGAHLDADPMGDRATRIREVLSETVTAPASDAERLGSEASSKGDEEMKEETPIPEHTVYAAILDVIDSGRTSAAGRLNRPWRFYGEGTLSSFTEIEANDDRLTFAYAVVVRAREMAQGFDNPDMEHSTTGYREDAARDALPSLDRSPLPAQVCECGHSLDVHILDDQDFGCAGYTAWGREHCPCARFQGAGRAPHVSMSEVVIPEHPPNFYKSIPIEVKDGVAHIPSFEVWWACCRCKKEFTIMDDGTCCDECDSPSCWQCLANSAGRCPKCQATIYASVPVNNEVIRICEHCRLPYAQEWDSDLAQSVAICAPCVEQGHRFQREACNRCIAKDEASALHMAAAAAWLDTKSALRLGNGEYEASVHRAETATGLANEATKKAAPNAFAFGATTEALLCVALHEHVKAALAHRRAALAHKESETDAAMTRLKDLGLIHEEVAG